jgi:hypothetical protein
MKTINQYIINWELHLLKVPPIKFTTEIYDPFQSPVKRWLNEKLLEFKRMLCKKHRNGSVQFMNIHYTNNKHTSQD